MVCTAAGCNHDFNRLDAGVYEVKEGDGTVVLGPVIRDGAREKFFDLFRFWRRREEC